MIAYIQRTLLGGAMFLFAANAAVAAQTMHEDVIISKGYLAGGQVARQIEVPKLAQFQPYSSKCVTPTGICLVSPPLPIGTPCYCGPTAGTISR